MNGFVFELVDSKYKYSESDLIHLEKVFSKPTFKGLLHNISLKKYIDWAKDGSSKGSLYLYYVRDVNNKIVAGLDLQIKNADEATIGFWKVPESSIRMHEILPQFLLIAKDHGILIIDAYTEPNNHKAIELLNRIGFDNQGLVNGKTKMLVKFVKRL